MTVEQQAEWISVGVSPAVGQRFLEHRIKDGWRVVTMAVHDTTLLVVFEREIQQDTEMPTNPYGPTPGPDWTADEEGRSNSGAYFGGCVAAVAEMIPDHRAVGDSPQVIAQGIVANLAHDYGLSPSPSPAAPLDPLPVQQAILDISAERVRQIREEGYTAKHDDTYPCGALAWAAACYAAPEQIYRLRVRGNVFGDDVPTIEPSWPWKSDSDKRAKHDRRRQLVIAGALIAAEIDRLDRAGEAT